MTVLSRFPHKLNYPWEITEGNARRQYELVLAMMSCLKAVISCVFTYITHTTVETAAGNSQGLGTAFLPIVLGGSFIPIVIYLVIANRNR